jgi:uncharacterized protein (DUF2267 family)
MSAIAVDSIRRTVQKTNEWLADFERELETDDPQYAWRTFGAYLQVLRDRLTVDEGAQLAAQLTHLLRGVFYEGYDPSGKPEKIRDRETFLALLAQRARLRDSEEAARVAAAATRTLRRHISEGELEDVFAQLPTEIRQVLDGH